MQFRQLPVGQGAARLGLFPQAQQTGLQLVQKIQCQKRQFQFVPVNGQPKFVLSAANPGDLGIQAVFLAGGGDSAVNQTYCVQFPKIRKGTGF